MPKKSINIPISVSSNTNSFPSTYYQLCQLYNVAVLTHVINHENNVLYLDVDKVNKDQDWAPIMKALRKNRDLKKIIIYSERQNSTIQKDTGNRFQGGKQIVRNIVRVLPDLMTSIRDCLLYNVHLTHLEISGIPMRDSVLKILSKGLMNNTKLTYFSVTKSKIGDSGVFVLAPAIRTIKSLRVLNLSDCDLTENGAHIVAAFLKSLAVRRQADQWAYSLRSSHIPEDIKQKISDAPKPLKRLIICSNQLGDAGCGPLLDLLLEDVGLSAIDMQCNNLTNLSAKKILHIMKQNTDLVVLDVRNNQIDSNHLDILHGILAKNLTIRIEKSEIKKHDRDLVWLDTKDPLKSIYFEEVQFARSMAQTQSSVKKLNLQHKKIDFKKPKINIIHGNVAVEKKNNRPPSKSEATEMVQVLTALNTFYNRTRNSNEPQSPKAYIEKKVTNNREKKSAPSAIKKPITSVPIVSKIVKTGDSISKTPNLNYEFVIQDPSSSIKSENSILQKENSDMKIRIKELECLVQSILESPIKAKNSNENIPDPFISDVEQIETIHLPNSDTASKTKPIEPMFQNLVKSESPPPLPKKVFSFLDPIENDKSLLESETLVIKNENDLITQLESFITQLNQILI